MGSRRTSSPAASPYRTRGSLTTRIEHNYLRRVESLPRDTRLLLLIAAAEPVGEMSLLWRAARQLGVSPEAAAPAEAAELIDFGVRIRFRHPLVRSAIYHSAVPDDRRTVHRALAEATDPRHRSRPPGLARGPRRHRPR